MSKDEHSKREYPSPATPTLDHSARVPPLSAVTTAFLECSNFLKKYLAGFLPAQQDVENSGISRPAQASRRGGRVEELRLTSELDGPMQFQAGLYYEDSEMPTSQPTFFGGDPALNPFGSGVVQLWDLFLDRLVTQKKAGVTFGVTKLLRT